MFILLGCYKNKYDKISKCEYRIRGRGCKLYRVGTKLVCLLLCF